MRPSRSDLGPFRGIWHHPYVDLEPYLDLTPLADIDEEIVWALAHLPVDCTGGSHKTMGIVPPSFEHDPYVDYGQVIAGFSRQEFARFVALSDTPDEFDLDLQSDYHFGEERDFPLSRKQVLYLKFKYRVYFPWKAFYELIPTAGWDDKTTGVGKAFTSEALRWFPRLVAYVKTLPFAEVGRCNILGLEANDHGTIHTDQGHTDQGAEEKPFVDHFITLCPRGDKRLFLWDEANQRELFIGRHAYWFNDNDFHGVAADPYFRYSIRVDGIFRTDFLDRLARDHA
jgi:hypothetical protein